MRRVPSIKIGLCDLQGQVSHIPSLGACDACLDGNVTCQKLVVMAVATKCEECNKKALPLPDVVHVGKSCKCRTDLST